MTYKIAKLDLEIVNGVVTRCHMQQEIHQQAADAEAEAARGEVVAYQAIAREREHDARSSARKRRARR